MSAAVDVPTDPVEVAREHERADLRRRLRALDDQEQREWDADAAGVPVERVRLDPDTSLSTENDHG